MERYARPERDGISLFLPEAECVKTGREKKDHAQKAGTLEKLAMKRGLSQCISVLYWNQQ